VDDVIGVLMQLGKEMRQDTKLGRHILEDPEMLGVDSLDDSGVTIRFLLKTRPLQQWPVKREMLRRIKNRFDELGIQIPYPHRSVYHHYPNGAASEEFPEVGAGRKAA
jgi:small-conductance mechanosensitive channel